MSHRPSSAQATGRDGAAVPTNEHVCSECQHVQSAHEAQDAVWTEGPNERAARLTQLGYKIEYEARKAQPIVTGVLDYFPLALLAIAEVSKIGNDQHNPGEPLHWERSKSTDEANTAIRHFLQRGTFDTDGARHLAKAAWRVLAALQKEIENDIENEQG